MHAHAPRFSPCGVDVGVDDPSCIGMRTAVEFRPCGKRATRVVCGRFAVTSSPNQGKPAPLTHDLFLLVPTSAERVLLRKAMQLLFVAMDYTGCTYPYHTATHLTSQLSHLLHMINYGLPAWHRPPYQPARAVGADSSVRCLLASGAASTTSPSSTSYASEA